MANIECFAQGKVITYFNKKDSRLEKRLRRQFKNCEELTGCPENCELRNFLESILDRNISFKKNRKSSAEMIILFLPEEMELLTKLLAEGKEFDANCANCEKVQKSGSHSWKFDPITEEVNITQPTYKRTCSRGGELNGINKPCSVPDEFELLKKLKDIQDNV